MATGNIAFAGEPWLHSGSPWLRGKSTIYSWFIHTWFTRNELVNHGEPCGPLMITRNTGSSLVDTVLVNMSRLRSSVEWPAWYTLFKVVHVHSHLQPPVAISILLPIRIIELCNYGYQAPLLHSTCVNIDVVHWQQFACKRTKGPALAVTMSCLNPSLFRLVLLFRVGTPSDSNHWLGHYTTGFHYIICEFIKHWSGNKTVQRTTTLLYLWQLYSILTSRPLG